MGVYRVFDSDHSVNEGHFEQKLVTSFNEERFESATEQDSLEPSLQDHCSLKSAQEWLIKDLDHVVMPPVEACNRLDH